MLPSPKPGARFLGATPLIELGCGVGAGGIGVFEEDGTGGGFCCCDVNEDDKDDLGSLVLFGDEADMLASRLGFEPPTSSSGNVMKKRHPNVVPKNAPSTV